jgi:hypothetical protein
MKKRTIDQFFKSPAGIENGGELSKKRKLDVPTTNSDE